VEVDTPDDQIVLVNIEGQEAFDSCFGGRIHRTLLSERVSIADRIGWGAVEGKVVTYHPGTGQTDAGSALRCPRGSPERSRRMSSPRVGQTVRAA